MQKIILYYKFTVVKDPAMAVRWQQELCARLNLRGRIIIAAHGINGTLGGELGQIENYIKHMDLTPEFKGIVYKWSDGSSLEPDNQKPGNQAITIDFPRLNIRVRDELVTLEPEKHEADEKDGDNHAYDNASKVFDVYDTGTPLEPAAWRTYLEEHPDAIVFDARNDYESDIGKFRGAITPKIKTFKDIKQELKKLPKDQPILTYCTGDIRCEYLSAYMKHTGFSSVYHLDGGIIKYGQQFGDDDFWQGKCYVFDKRMSIGFSEKSEDIATCTIAGCAAKTSHQENCADSSCDLQFVVCRNCVADAHRRCDRHDEAYSPRYRPD